MKTRKDNIHPLLGTWVDPYEEAATVEYMVRRTRTGFAVSALDAYDGKTIKITDVFWTGQELRFESFVPSTKWRFHHVFRVVSDNEIEHEYTKKDIWKCKGTVKTKSFTPATTERRIVPRGDSGENKMIWRVRNGQYRNPNKAAAHRPQPRTGLE